MNAHKANIIGVRHEEVLVGCFGGKYGGQWIAYVPDPDRGRRVLTQGSVFKCVGFVADLRDLQA